MKKWLYSRESAAEKLLKQIGISNVHGLMNVALLISIHYGARQKDGCMVFIKVDKVEFKTTSLYFDFVTGPITINLDPNPKFPMGGDLKDIPPHEDLLIEGVGFDTHGWSVLLTYKGVVHEIRANLDIDVIFP